MTQEEVEDLVLNLNRIGVCVHRRAVLLYIITCYSVFVALCMFVCSRP